MPTKVKFLILISSIPLMLSCALLIFIRTDYAKSELAFFRQYPYLEMAARRNPPQEKIQPRIKTPPPILTVQLKKETILDTQSASIAEIKTSPQIKNSVPLTEDKFTWKKSPRRQMATQKIAKKENKITLSQNSSDKSLSDKPPPKEPTENWRHAASLGYRAFNQQNYTSAIRYFEQVLHYSPHQKDIILQLAYAYKILGKNAGALQYFKRAIDHMNSDDIPVSLKREVEQLENRFDVSGYIIFRDKSSRSRHLAGPDLTQSQMGLEISYQPPEIGYNNGRTFQIYSRILSATEDNNLTPDRESIQGGMGLRWKPLSRHNLILSAERLIRIGDFARNDWMLRAGYSYDHNSDYQENKTHWWSYSLYLDAAVIDPSSPDIFLVGQFTGGLNMPLADGFILQPHITGHLSWQRDSFQEASLIEAGPGVKFRYYFNDTKYEAFRSYIDLTVEYRLKLSGNSIGGSGWVASLLVHF